MTTCASCGTENPEGARFCYSCGTTLGAPAEGTRESRKTVSVLFIDAVSSTALGERMDPESLRAVMTRYFDVMREAIESHGGAVEKFIGDAVMAIFGVPTVHEDDALRACRAAVEIRSRLAELEPQIRADRGVAIEWRAGINTGAVVAGDVAAGQRMVTGDAVNVAARLEAAAAPGEILLGAETYALVREAVSTEAVEPLALKGKSEPVPAWRLKDVSETVGRHARPSDAPLVGRLRPLRNLDDAFHEAVEERICHLFTIIGSAGVGKSRVVDEFIGALGEQAQVASGRCLAYGQGITYWPVAEAIRDGCGIAEGDSPQDAIARLRQVLGAEPEGERVAAIVGGLLGVQDSPPAPDQIFWAIRKTFEALARSRPLVLVFDDIHWGEPTFLDLIEHMADWTRDAPILLIAMARAELLEKRPTWGGGKRWVTTMSLEPLSELESEELVASLLGRADLPAEFRTHISHAAEGNPLFVEELLAKLIDDGFLVQSNGGWAAPGDLRQLALPPTIQALLAARLDGLGNEERSVIERASVEGKVFHRGAVTEMAPELLRPQVRDRLASLMRMELVRPDQASFAGDEAYRFRHLLIRDAAYQALAKQTRSELHERFAAWLERVAADRLVEYEEIIAYHLEQAYRYRTELGPPDVAAMQLATRSGTLLAQACRRAEGRGDIAATVELLQRAIDLLPPGAERRLLIAQVGLELLAGGNGARAESLLTEVLAEAQAAHDDRAAAWARISLLIVRSSTQSAEPSAYVREAEQLRDQLTALNDVEGAQQAELVAAWGLFVAGKAGECFTRAQAVLDSIPRRGEPIAAVAMRQRGPAAVFGPLPADEVLRLLGESIEDGFGIPGGELGAGRMLAVLGQIPEARAMVARGRERISELGDRILLSTVDSAEGFIAMMSGDTDEAIRAFQRSYDTKVATGDRGFASTAAAEVAEAYLEANDLPRAWDYATIARETSAADDIASQAGGRQIQARVLSARGDHVEAETLARQAVAIMQETDYLMHHGDALVHLAHVLRAAGKGEEAAAAAREAVEVYDRKRATFFAERTRRLIEEWGTQPA